MIGIKVFLLIFIGTLLKNVSTSSVPTIPSVVNTNNSGSKDLPLNADDQYNKKELVEQIRALELQFQKHVSESKAESEDQYEAITILKAARKTQEEKFKKVFNEMEVLKDQNQNQLARIVQLEEILSQTKSDDTSSIQAITKQITTTNNDKGKTIPSSCEDLKLGGHHLNGIYMVFDANAKKVLATYCDFRQSSSTATVAKKVVGSLNINSLVGGVYFYAQMTTTFKEIGKTIPFDRIILNQGNGLNPSNKGVFTAPRAGIYHFTFKGNSWSGSFLKPKQLNIQIRHNGVAVGDVEMTYGVMHIHATLKLQAGDRITMFKLNSGELYSDDIPDTHFSGWLLEEDVSIM